jgi:beta-lactamase regulating signal transducer with metallopeptidase domain
MCIRRVGPQCAERPGPRYNEGRLLTRLTAGGLYERCHPYRRRTQPVGDEALNALLESLHLRLGCLRPVELRESAEIAAPATVGWRRRLILLPPQWREWSEAERQAVLAHEVAHIVRGDFVAWFVAQLGVVLHFYNPLVHWLARRLRIEQELAADALGAMAAGGSGTYLSKLWQ